MDGTVAFFQAPITAPANQRVLAVLGLSVWDFCYFYYSLPPFFAFITAYPHDGADFKSLLQDPGLVIHPPMLTWDM